MDAESAERCFHIQQENAPHLMHHGANTSARRNLAESQGLALPTTCKHDSALFA
jgi:hypothetical protein